MKVAIVFWSGTGNTETMAEILAQNLCGWYLRKRDR